MDWKIVDTPYFTHDLLEALFHNDVSAVRVPAFLSTQSCRRVVDKIPSSLFEWYRYAGAKEHRVSKIGLVQNEHKSDSERKGEYFRQVERATRERQRIFEKSGDLLYYVMGFVKAAWGSEVTIAEEGIGQPYFAGVIRSIGEGALHFDWAPIDAKGWQIETISAQLTWNIYLQLGSQGGATSLYRHYGREEDHLFKEAGSIHTDYRLVSHAEQVSVVPRLGDLILFNPRNYHKIEKSEGTIARITLSSFFGVIDKKRLIFWS